MRTHILAAALLLAGSAASGQEFTGSIYGRIVDPANGLLPGVSITVEGAAIQGPRTAESEANGSYRLLNLPPGEYRVTYQKARFKKIVYEGAKVEINKTIAMNVTMQLAAVEETLVVTGSSPVVDVKNATVGTNFGTAMLRDIPNQRDLFALLAQTPGITMGDFRGRLRQASRRGSRYHCRRTPQPIQRRLLPEPSGERRQVAQRPNPHEGSRLHGPRAQGIS